MRVTTKGQVTIPQPIREKMGITPNTEVDFVEENGRVYLTTKMVAFTKQNRFRLYRGVATVKMSTNDIISLMRGEK